MKLIFGGATSLCYTKGGRPSVATGRGGYRPTKARIIIANSVLEAEFFDTPCAAAVVASLPLTSRPEEWGDEFYFTVPVDMPLDETATKQVTAGAISKRNKSTGMLLDGEYCNWRYQFFEVMKAALAPRKWASTLG